MAISETIEVNASEAIAQLDAFGQAAEEAAAKYAAAMEKASRGFTGGAGAASADKMAGSMDKAAAAADKMAASFGKIAGAADSAAGGVDRIGKAADAAAGGLGDVSATADEAAAASDRLAASSDAAGAALDRQAVAGGRAATSGKAAGESGGSGWKTLGTVMLGAGVAAAYGIDRAMKFQSQMLLLHTQAGVSVKDTATMTQGVLQISAQTGQSLGAVAESAYHVASNMESLGGTPVQMLKAVKIAAEGAAVGHSNLVDTTTALTSVLASGIPGAKNYSQAMGALNSTVGSGEMNMQQLAEALGTGVVPVVKGYGLTLKDTGAALATYGDLNIRGAKAGTELRMAVQALAVPAAAGKTELKALGLTTSSLSKDMQSGGLLKALDDLNSKFKENGITAKNEGAVITELFGKKAGAGLALLMENMDRVQSKYPAITRDANNFNAAWQATQQSPAQKWKELKTGLGDSAVNFGLQLLPAFSSAAGFADKILADLNGSKGAWKDIAIGAGGLATLFTANKLASGVKEAFQTGQTVLKGVGKVSEVLNIPGLSKLANIGKGATGAAALDGSAARLTGAAEALTGAAEKLGGTGGLGGLPGKAEGGAVGAGEGAAAAGLTGETVALGAGMLAPVALGAGAGAALALWANQYKKYDHPAPADQQGPRSAGNAANSQAWKQYDQLTPAAPKQWQSVLGPQTVKPVKIGAPDLSALAAAKGKAAQAAEGIHTATQTPLNKPVKAKAPDLSAYAAAKAKAAADGAAIDAGLAQGISANAGAAISAAQRVASQVSAAMSAALQVHSPSKVTAKIGASAVDGLVVGLEGGQAAVTAASQALGKQVAKAADVTAIDNAITKGIGYAGKDSALVKFLKGDQAKLLALSAQRTKLEQEITDSQQIAQQAIANSNITGAGAYTPVLAASDGPLAASSTVTGMQAQAADQKQFTQVIGQLSKDKLNPTSLNQFTQAGVSSLPQALGLAQGGKAAISQVNAAESSIQASARKLGDVGGTAMYQAGVQAGQGLATGLKSALGSVESAIEQMASQIKATIKKDLKISSPSQVFAGFGMALPQGLAQGVNAGSGIAESAVARMGNRVASAYHPGYSGGHGGGGAGDTHTTVNVTMHIQGSVMSENDLISTVQRGLLKKSNSNWQAGIVIPGRRT